MLTETGPFLVRPCPTFFGVIPVVWRFARTGRSMYHLCSAVLTYFAGFFFTLLTVAGGFTCMWVCCPYTRERFECTHGDVLNAHMEVSACHTTTNTPHHTHHAPTHTHQHHTNAHTTHTHTNTHTTPQPVHIHTNTHFQHTPTHTTSVQTLNCLISCLPSKNEFDKSAPHLSF